MKLLSRLDNMPTVWKPNMRLDRPNPQPPPLNGRTDPDDATSSSQSTPPSNQPDLLYSGIGYSAQWNRYWELPCGGKGSMGSFIRVRAAQLQHRLPCWSVDISARGKIEEGFSHFSFVLTFLPFGSAGATPLRR